MASVNGKIITVTSRKGGVGKTTTLLNLAGCFSNMGKKTLILDLDLYSNSIASSLNLKVVHDIYNLVDDISNNRFTEFFDYVTKYNDNIGVLASLLDPRVASKINPKYIEQIINMAKHFYDIILIDTNHVLNDLNIVIYDTSDTILSILSNNPIDLVNTKTFVNIISSINFPDFRILLNESLTIEDDYFSLYDIREFINYNINYRLKKDYFVKNIDKYVLEGKILTLNNIYSKEKYDNFMKIALDLLKNK